MHAENGFLKIFPLKDENIAPRKVQASYSHPFGMNEFEFGEITADTLTLAATEERHFQRPADPATAEAKAKQVTGIRREYRLAGEGHITFQMFLAVGGGDLQLHLEGELRKVNDE